MSKIITITLNPSIDKSTSIDKLIPEKKLKCAQPNFEPGGGGINVSRAIKRLGGESNAIYLAGGYSGHFFTTLLSKENIESTVVKIDSHTRENLIVYEQENNVQYRFGMPGPTISKNEWMQLLFLIEERKDIDYIVASGSVPEGIPSEIFASIAKIAKNKNAKYIIDTSGEALKFAVNEGAFLIKPNLTELSFLLGKEVTKHTIIGDTSNLIQTGKCENIVVSLGAEGALLLTKENHYFIPSPPAKRKSTVGAGDSMVGGIVYSLAENKSVLDAVKFGVACGTAATMNPGTELFHKEDALTLLSIINSKL